MLYHITELLSANHVIGTQELSFEVLQTNADMERKEVYYEICVNFTCDFTCETCEKSHTHDMKDVCVHI